MIPSLRNQVGRDEKSSPQTTNRWFSSLAPPGVRGHICQFKVQGNVLVSGLLAPGSASHQCEARWAPLPQSDSVSILLVKPASGLRPLFQIGEGGRERWPVCHSPCLSARSLETPAPPWKALCNVLGDPSLGITLPIPFPQVHVSQVLRVTDFSPSCLQG